VYERRPCIRCLRPKPAGVKPKSKTCGSCRLVDAIWPRLVPGPGDCWIYTGSVSDGYGGYGGKLAHRLVYEELVGEIPAGLDLDHLCIVKLCVNPWHLEPVTRSENSKRKWAIYTRCKNGHEFTPANTYVNPNTGIRSCRTCTNANQRAYQQRKKAVRGVGAGPAERLAAADPFGGVLYGRPS
jgi:hypothetical protein